MSIFTNFDKVKNNVIFDFDSLWENKIKPFIDADIEPALKQFLQLFDSQLGKQALQAALGAAASLTGGEGFSAVAAALASSILNDASIDAKSDATTVLTTVQAALQVAKTANNVVTPADQTAAASLSETE